MLLSDIKTGESCIILKVNGSGAFRKRILEMGFIRGKKVKSILNAPLKDPIKYGIMDYEVSLRRSEASLIEVIPIDPNVKIDADEYLSSYIDPFDVRSESIAVIANKDEIQRTKTINIALVGNPNCGKTTLFNRTSGAREHVGNYSGVTVDSKEGKFKKDGYNFNIYDLPGTYSLSAYTPEERYVRNFIVDEKPDIIINIVAASNLERNLYLTTELLDLKVPIVIALNMYDELISSGSKFDFVKLSKLIGVPIIPIVAKNGEGVDTLFDTIINLCKEKVSLQRYVNISYGNSIENAISRLNIFLEKQKTEFVFPVRYISIKLIEGDSEIEKYIKDFSFANEILEIRDRIASEISAKYHEDIESMMTNARYGFIAGGLKETFEGKNFGSETTRKLDAIVTSRIWGFPIFFFLMFIMFAATFVLGDYPKTWLEDLIELIGDQIEIFMPEGMLKDLLVQGIIGGVGEVIVFLPNIIILYAFISFMEDSGYMARAAFVMDRVMHKMGLHGKSFIPLIMGFGCNVPAILASRTIESHNSRMITILINPFMSCTARLPIYLLFSGVFFGKYAALALFSLYVIGILLAVVSAKVFKLFVFKGEDNPFVMELPPYRIPTLKATFTHMWDKSREYLKKMGGIILIASIIIWFLQYFPINDQKEEQLELRTEEIEKRYDDGFISDETRDEALLTLQREMNLEHQKESYIGRIGTFIEPVLEPLGFDWKTSVGLLTGLAAKEVFISTIGVLYAADGDNEQVLVSKLAAEKKTDGKPVFTTLNVISLLLFVLIYFPCVATITAIKEESGSWKWGIFSMIYTTSLAWVISFIVYQVGSFFWH